MKLLELNIIILCVSLIECKKESLKFAEEKYETGLISISKSKGDLFYWLCNPRSNNSEAPVVMWLDGGPGNYIYNNKYI